MRGPGAARREHTSRETATPKPHVPVPAISDDIVCRGLLVHGESERAGDFYLHLIPELERSPTDEVHLVLLLEDVKKTLQDDGR